MELAGVTDRHNRLNPAIWVGDKLDQAVKQRLLGVADAFTVWAKSPMRRLDVVLTGSSANYNYAAGFSDVDLHLVYKFNSLPSPTERSALKDALSAKQAVWNLEHRISIRGLPVEIYVQASDEPHYSTGVYSVENNLWLARPTMPPAVDATAIDRKVSSLRAQIGQAIASGDYAKMDAVKQKVKKIRQAGLDASGELSLDNLAFKVLRRTDEIATLLSAMRHAQDSELSLGAGHCHQDDHGDFGIEVLSGIKSAVAELTAE